MITDKEYPLFVATRDRMIKSLMLFDNQESLEFERVTSTIIAYAKLIKEYETANGLQEDR